MSTTIQLSLDNIREQQLLELMERDPSLGKAPSEAAKNFFFRQMEKVIGVKPAVKKA